MILSLKGFSRIVEDSAAAVQASCSSLIDMGVGSVMRAFVEATASVALWLQFLIVKVWKGCRLSTSVGADVDSFVGDYGLTRLPPVAAVGSVTFSRFTTVTTALIPVGTTVRSYDQTATFAVTADTTNSAWNAGLNGYLFQAGVGSLTVPVTATAAGSVGNVQAGAISIIASSLEGVDSVINNSPLENGADAETDDVLKARFIGFINTLPRGTPEAVEFAIQSVEQGLSYSLAENTDPTGAYIPGNFMVTVDDGTGHPSTGLIDLVTAAIEAVRPIGSRFIVLPPTVVPVTVSLAITVGPDGDKAIVAGRVRTALLSYIDSLKIAEVLPYSRISVVAYMSDPTITNVTQITVNSGLTDVDPGPRGVIKTSIVTVN